MEEKGELLVTEEKAVEDQRKANVFSSAWKKTVDGIQKATKTIVEKSKENSHKKQMKKLNPLFPDKFKSADFHLPNVIKIVDDAVRRDNPLCEGAIGWIENIDGVEILCLYDEWAEQSGIQFVPVWKCDSTYYVDSFERNRYIETNSLFTRVNEEKLAELEDIAYCLGAKYCSVEIVENESEIDRLKTNTSLRVKKTSVEVANAYENKAVKNQSNKKISNFNGHNNPKRPVLKWFTYDDNVNSLIEKRCNDIFSVKSQVFELSGSCRIEMNQKTACAIDKLQGIKGNRSMEKQAAKEVSRKLIFEIEF